MYPFLLRRRCRRRQARLEALAAASGGARWRGLAATGRRFSEEGGDAGGGGVRLAPSRGRVALDPSADCRNTSKWGPSGQQGICEW
eukprot:6902865-Pyramimonas_sp.AAC.1